MVKNAEILKKNYNFFLKKLPHLLKEESNKNKFALISKNKIIGIYKTFDKTLDVAIKEQGFELETFIIQKIEEQKIHKFSRVV